ncbi:MAG: ATP-dependent DNA helicase [archaeon]
MTTKEIYFRHNEFRKGQKEIVQEILQSLSLKKNILIHAPTGLGKTDASLSAAISFAKENNLKILFLTPKTSQHKIALEAVIGVNQKYNLDLKVIDFVGKKNMCTDPVIHTVSSGFYEICKIARDKKQCPFYENIKPTDKNEKAVLKHSISKMFNNINSISHHEIKELAFNNKSLSNEPKPLCSYELAKIYAKDCEIIIADYYHVFSNKVSSSLLSEININLKDCILIVDEAHNLEERILKLLSKSLNTYIIDKAIKEAKDLQKNKLKTILYDLQSDFEKIEELKLKKEHSIVIERNDILSKYQDDILALIEEFEEAGLQYIEEKKEDKSALLNIALFIEDWVQEKDTHVRLIKKEKDLLSVKYNALDASLITKDIINSCYATILMSATLTPLSMYEKILGLDEKQTVAKEYASPFEESNRLNILINDVSTKYTQRSTDEYKKIANYLIKIVNAIPGNVITFFPSFEILNIVKAYVKFNKPLLAQEEHSTTIDFENMINNFKKHSMKFGSCLFAVMGGKASEGIDLPGNDLIAAIIVGIPLSKMDLEVKSKIDYYEKKFNNGWLFAYIQPAIQKVIQSSGRVIRSETDRGVIIYMDERYLWDNYRKCLPRTVRFKITKEPEVEIEKFFGKSLN